MALMIADGKPNDVLPTPPAPFDWVADAPFFQAGLAGYSDAAMRLVARKHGCPYCVTEAMLDHFLINGGKGLAAAEIRSDDHPIAGQLMGSHAVDIAKGARILVDLGYDVIDINLACPVKKIKKKARGGHLLSDPETAIEILDAVAQSVAGDRPLAVKLRRGYDDEGESEAKFHRIFEKVIELGYALATVHCRTVEQKYNGPGRWPFLAKLTETYRAETEAGFLIFGSGDIFSPQAILDMLQQTNVRGVSVARGCIGNPWIFEQVQQLMRGEAMSEPTIAQQRQVLLEHFELSVEENGEKLAGRMMRKFGIKFSTHHPTPDLVKDAFIKVTSLADWHAALDKFYGVEASAP